MPALVATALRAIHANEPARHTPPQLSALSTHAEASVTATGWERRNPYQQATL